MTGRGRDTLTAPPAGAVATMPRSSSLGIGAAAEKAGVSQRALRYYQQIGLLTPCGCTPGGLRRYSRGGPGSRRQDPAAAGAPRPEPGRDCPRAAR